MFALKAGQDALRSAGYGRGSRAGAGDLVLPRWLRRPVRYVARLTAGEVEAPRFCALISSAALIGGFVIYGTIAGGHVETVIKEVTSRTGFAVEEVRITGNRQTSEIDVFGQVGLDGWTSLIGLDVDEARARIMELPWVQGATVRKVYPSALEVRIEEKEAFAIWQQEGRLTLVEASGEPITSMRGRGHAELPLVIGRGAGEAAKGFLSKVAEHPELATRVAAYVRIGDRRWDMRLSNGVTVRLPEHGVEAALSELATLQRERSVLSRDLVAIDMRLSDRVVFRLGEDALAARDAALKERLGRAYKPVERQI